MLFEWRRRRRSGVDDVMILRLLRVVLLEVETHLGRTTVGIIGQFCKGDLFLLLAATAVVAAFSFLRFRHLLFPNFPPHYDRCLRVQLPVTPTRHRGGAAAGRA